MSSKRFCDSLFKYYCAIKTPPRKALIQIKINSLTSVKLFNLRKRFSRYEQTFGELKQIVFLQGPSADINIFLLFSHPETDSHKYFNNENYRFLFTKSFSNVKSIIRVDKLDTPAQGWLILKLFLQSIFISTL